MHSFSTQSEPNAITITGEILFMERENEVKKKKKKDTSIFFCGM